MIQVKQFRYESAVQVNPVKFRDTSIYEKATGRIMTAFCSDQELVEIIDRNGFPAERWDGINTMDDLREATAGIREKGMVDIYTQKGEL